MFYHNYYQLSKKCTSYRISIDKLNVFDKIKMSGGILMKNKKLIQDLIFNILFLITLYFILIDNIFQYQNSMVSLIVLSLLLLVIIVIIYDFIQIRNTAGDYHLKSNKIEIIIFFICLFLLGIVSKNNDYIYATLVGIIFYNIFVLFIKIKEKN